MAPDFDIGDDAMTQEMASIARAIQTILPNHKCFYEELPEGYTSPAIFFPIPDVGSLKYLTFQIQKHGKREKKYNDYSKIIET